MLPAEPSTEVLLLQQTGTFAMIRRLIGEHGRTYVLAYAAAGLLMAVSAVATGASVSLLRPIVNGMMSASDFKHLRWLAFVTAGLYMLRGVATYGQLVIMSRTGNKIVATVQARVYDHLLRQDVDFFQTHHSSEFMARLAMAANGVRDTLQLLISSLGRDILTVIALAIVMLVEDPLMAILAISVVPVAAAALGQVIRRVRKFARRSFDGSTRIMQTMQETVLGIRIIKSFGLEETMRSRMAAAIREVQRSANRMAAGVALSGPLSDTLGGLAVAGIILYGSWRVTLANADPGSFFAFMAALLMAYEPARRLGRLNLDVQSGLVGARLIYEIIDMPAREDHTPGKPPLAVAEGRIVFEAVDFHYRAGEPVLRGLELVVEPNRMTALVGPSGAGKTTIINLIQRFYDPCAGTMRIDGQDIGEVDLASLRARIAFVSQDVFLFRGTIRDNIALGKPGATDTEIRAAASKAHAHEFISGFAAGYATSVGEQGAQLSGGQRQRIAIARAILKNAHIILLDEPTAALDSESEREVQKALDELRLGRTVVVVAHRLQTIINADTICVIEGGRAVERGTHQELIARGGSYQAFFAAQFGANTRSLLRATTEPDGDAVKRPSIAGANR
ncbi:MAG: ABC transporter ATP-binding protein [Methylobacteriaceae bacterium]|nr:ABC transporter ATP-binding protein [Methylobacteriaceae bacterium]